MDGNGRWARERSLARIEGHKKGAEAIEPLMDSALHLGLKAISLYAFSTENWKRPRTEILSLWKLLEFFFESKMDAIQKNGIRIMHSGFKDRLPAGTRRVIENAESDTALNKKIILNFCVNYGGRQEIVAAVNSWLSSTGKKNSITEKDIERNLFTSRMPPVDLLIRTSGEYRISNYFLWQIAYSELVFTDVLWPDFRPAHLYKCIYDFQQRNRRYGGI
jgi:undecaprenyl diphosphate synthase